MAKSPKKALPPADHEPTRLESPEEIRQAFLVRQARGKEHPATVVEPMTPTERPQQRPPLALVCVLDDGQNDGEWVRLRGENCVIGRMEGDIRVPHDTLMSSRHAELRRKKLKEGYRWFIADLESTNGTWVRIGSSLLKQGNEIIIGRSRYRFEGGAAEMDEPIDIADEVTRSWTAPLVRSLVPALVEVTPTGPGKRLPLTLTEYWLGRDAKQCAIAPQDDLFINPLHARLYRDPKGKWHVENNRSVNGLWLRVVEAPLTSACQFRVGEQRFLFRIP